MPPTPSGVIDPEKFMAILAWVRDEGCNCPAAEYFKHLGDYLIKRHIGGAKSGRKRKG